MFDPIKLMGMLKKAQDLKQKIENDLKDTIVVGSSGGGMVKISMNGQFEINKIYIDPTIFNKGDICLLEDLIKASVNDSTKKIKDTLIDKMKNLTNNISLFNTDKK